MGRIASLTGSSQLTVDLAAVRRNWRRLAARAAPSECGAVIKANAYGLGALRVGAALKREGCRSFFVARLCEALELEKELGPQCAIYILNGVDPDCEEQCAAFGFIPVLNSMSQIAGWRALARQRGRPLAAALQIDTGMSRLGIGPEDAARLAGDETLTSEIDLRLILSHLACADTVAHPANAAQIEHFAALRQLFPSVKASLANTSGIYLSKAAHHDLVRPGLGLYGALDAPEAETLEPALKLQARVLQVRDIAAGAGVGYGLDFVASAPARIATLAIGYADGWPRSLAGRGCAFYRGRRLALVGRVSMDTCSVDVTALGLDAPQEGEFVDLIGEGQSIADAARAADTNAHEMLTRIGRRHRRLYCDGDVCDVEPPGAWG